MNSFLKIFFRNLRNGGVYSAINIGGLTVGMAVAGLILLWVFHHRSYDRFHEKDKYLYKVWTRNDANGYLDKTPAVLGPTLTENYADFADMTRYGQQEIPLMFIEENSALFGGNEFITIGTTDPGFLRMFNFPLLRGDASTALNEPLSLILTESAAQRIFGDKDPMGKTISVWGNVHFTVTGVMADLPANTEFKFDVLVPMKRFEPDLSWISKSNKSLYVELRPGVDAGTAGVAIRDIVEKHTDGRDRTETYLQHVSRWHLWSNFTGGLIETLRMFTLIALLILLTACINFMNLRTAQSAKYAKETGIRKVIGARRSGLTVRFLGESISITVLAGAAAAIIVSLCLPYFNALTGEQVGLNFGNPGFWAGMVSFVVLTGLLAGSYPAFYLSSFLPTKVLKGTFTGERGFLTSRKVLVVAQFMFAVILIGSTSVIQRQIHHAKARDIGYDKSRLISVQLGSQVRHTKELLRRELLASGVAESVSNNFAAMTESQSTFSDTWWRGKNPEDDIIIERNYAEADWAKTTGVEIIQGRDIDIRAYPNDSTAMLLNEAAVKVMDFDDPIGEVVREWGREYHVVGVVRDFVLESPYDPIRPMTIGGPAGWINNMNIKLSAAGSMSENLNRVEAIFRKYNPGQPFMYQFADEAYARKFDREQRMGSMITWFAALAVFISCLGLFGLSAYTAESRRKEIGIRKVIGASITDIVSLLSREFLVLVSVSLVIGIPVAWYAMSRWLEGYAYRTNIPWYLFAIIAGLTIGIALITVCFQAIKAATADPVKSIKTE